MKEMKFYTEEEMIDKHVGVKGTPQREQFEENLQAFLVGEAIKKARLSKHLTQEELGTLIGVQRAQISRIENGKNLTLNTIVRVFRAMDISAKLEIGNVGDVILW
jgi:DNA-binding XRE family transcriptional regulator